MTQNHYLLTLLTFQRFSIRIPEETAGLSLRKLQLSIKATVQGVFPLQCRGNLPSLVYAVAERATGLLKGMVVSELSNSMQSGFGTRERNTLCRWF